MAIYIGLFKVMQNIYFGTRILAAFVSNCVGRNLMLSFSSSFCNNSILFFAVANDRCCGIES